MKSGAWSKGIAVGGTWKLEVERWKLNVEPAAGALAIGTRSLQVTAAARGSTFNVQLPTFNFPSLPAGHHAPLLITPYRDGERLSPFQQRDVICDLFVKPMCARFGRLENVHCGDDSYQRETGRPEPGLTLGSEGVYLYPLSASHECNHRTVRPNSINIDSG